MSRSGPDDAARDPSTTMPLSAAIAHSISAAVTRGGIRPVDFAVEELRRAQDRAAWIEAALHLALGGGGPGGGIARMEDLVKTARPREELDELRRRATMAFGGATRVEARNAALVAYAFVVAAGLVHHRALLSSQPREEIEVLLAELAGVLGEPFASFLESAVKAGGLAA